MPPTMRSLKITVYRSNYKSHNEPFYLKYYLSQTFVPLFMPFMPLTYRGPEKWQVDGNILSICVNTHVIWSTHHLSTQGSLGVVRFREMMRGCDLKRTLNVLRRLIFSSGWVTLWPWLRWGGHSNIFRSQEEWESRLGWVITGSQY